MKEYINFSDAQTHLPMQMSPWMQVYILLVKTDLNFCLEHCYAHPVCWWSSVACSTTIFNSSPFLSNNYNPMPLICPIFPFSFLSLQFSLCTSFPSHPWCYLVFSVTAHPTSYSFVGMCVECLKLNLCSCAW